ncbi:hypothetical protein [Streptococcus agalactiae]|uniref:hypothetical protein n=1 Tax=Streptococcus agalactiae TaxID=1311 RepID=UPI000BADFAE8|nr:hypothetical protein [Streptococcus agalactiae]ASZ00526.1 hypothetical protein CHF17_00179 [Streptococcus agalactiae]
MIGFILKNIHTLILLVGLGLLIYGLFLFGDKVGFIASGIILVILAIYVDSVGEENEQTY